MLPRNQTIPPALSCLRAMYPCFEARVYATLPMPHFSLRVRVSQPRVLSRCPDPSHSGHACAGMGRGAGAAAAAHHRQPAAKVVEEDDDKETDQWVQCSKCQTWRQVPDEFWPDIANADEDEDWTCKVGADAVAGSQ